MGREHDRREEQARSALPETLGGKIDLFRAAFDAAGVAMMVIAPELGTPGPTIAYVNAAMTALTGYSAAELVGGSLRLLLEPRSNRGELRRCRLSLARDARYEGTITNHRKDGTAYRAECVITAISGRNGAIQGWLALYRDRTGRPGPGATSAETDAHRQVLLEGIPHLVWQSQDNGQWCAASPQWIAFTGQNEASSLGTGWRRMIAPQDRSATEAAWRVATEDGTLAVEHRIRRQDGTYRWFQTRALPMPMPEGQGGERLWIGTSTDIHDLRVAEERIRHLAYHDTLTEIGNRGMLQDVLERMTGHPAAMTPFNLFFLDIDDFKSVNDQLGHRGGDEALREIARRLGARMRGDDTVARIGGDEFVLVQANATPADGLQVADRIGALLSEPFVSGTQELRFSASVGMASYPGDGADAEALLRRADLALFNARGGGGGRLRQFEPAMEHARQEHLVVQTGLARAIERDELRVAYQAACCITTGRVHGYEALARWTHPERGAVPPATFIPIAEESGLIIPIGQWILERACREAAEPALVARRIAVNLSPRQFRSASLARMVAETLDRTGLEPDRLELEVTERLLMDNNEEVNRTLRDLKDMGISIALDDFGTGYSNLAYLCRFPFDRLKIDRSFVARVAEDDGAKAVVGGIIALAHNLRLQVTAEGVETDAQLEVLREMGCDLAQGFLLGYPVPLSDLRTDPGPSAP